MRAWLVLCDVLSALVGRWDTAGLDDGEGEAAEAEEEEEGGGRSEGSGGKLCRGDKSQAHRERWSGEVCRPTGKG